MKQEHPAAPNRPLRLWPGIVAVSLQWVLRFVVPFFVPAAVLAGVIGGIAGAAAVVVWWLFFSRAPWAERLGAIALMAGALMMTSRFVDISIATGAQRLLLPILALPFLSLGLVLWAAATRHFSPFSRHAALIFTIAIICGGFTLVRTGGFTADFRNDLHWRWSKSPEDMLLQHSSLPSAPNLPPPAERAPAKVSDPEPKFSGPPKKSAPALPDNIQPEPAEAAPAAAVWNGFRGPNRDSRVAGLSIQTDWSNAAPVLLWRRAIGPGWSSFAVQGDFLYTQEQRGPREVVACYRVSTGQPVWAHRDTARFWESNAGAGPRATPALFGGRVYTFGATGILNALNAKDGSKLWSRNAAVETNTQPPDWGFAGSPLVVGDLVVVGVSGQLAAYDRATGAPRWLGPKHRTSYSSPQLAAGGGTTQVLLLNADGLTSVSPKDGRLLWEHAWSGYPIVQPAILENGDVLIAINESSGVRRLAVTHTGQDWNVQDRWTSNGLKPYFNDFVIHKGHAYGFDGAILACIGLEDGKRKWKGGRYGHGQLTLLPDQDLLVVLSEDGELALVQAAPGQFTELAKIQALEGKTWNHPAIAGGILLARNGQEMAAFRFTPAPR